MSPNDQVLRLPPVRMPRGMRNLFFVPLILLAMLAVRAETRARLPASPQPPSRILPPSPGFRFPEDQRFVYSIEWHMVNAGTITIVIRHTPSAEHLHSRADTSGMTNRVYPVHDTFDAEIEPRTFCTQEVSHHSEEGSRRLDKTIRLDYSSSKSRVDEFDLRTKREKHSEFDIPPCVTDVVSGFFYVSSLPIAQGFSETFPVTEGGRTSDVRVEVEARETVKVGWGESRALRAEVEPVSGPMQGRGKIWVWFTDDSRRIPLRIKSKLGFATLVFKLERIETAAGAK